jgi:predicted DNA-binding transcriptional regulator AlpA
MREMPWPRMLRLKTAAAYCDLSHEAFLREVAAGRLPRPVELGGAARWDRTAIDLALDELVLVGRYRDAGYSPS